MVAVSLKINTNCVGLREVLKDTPATVVPTKDSLALSKALESEMRNPTTEKMKRFSVEAAIRFDVKERATELEILLLKLIEKNTTAISDND